MSSGVAELSGCKRQKVVPSEQIDRINSLPDSVLAHILSFLPTKDAVKTVLIRRFGNLWTSIHNLDFDACLYHNCEEDGEEIPRFEKRLIDFIRHALILHERSDVYRFRLRLEFSLWYSTEDYQDDPQFHDSVAEESKLAYEIDTWIRFAVRKKVKVLDLDFRACSFFAPEVYHKLPNVVLASDLLTELYLVSCNVEPPEHICMKSLKTLALNNVLISNKAMIQIQSGCPILENLFLIECNSLQNLNFTSVNLKNVVIERCWPMSPRLEISCPYVTSLRISGTGGLDLSNVPSIVDAALDFDIAFKCARGKHHKVKMLFEKFHHAKVFTMSTRTILVFTIWELTKKSCPSTNWRCLVLKTMLTKWQLPGIASLLRSSPNLEMLDIRIEPGSIPFCWYDDPWLKKYDFDGDYIWTLQCQSFHCLTSHVKTIRIHGFRTEYYAIQLVQFLLKRAEVLEKMVIETGGDDVYPDQKKHFMSDELQKFSEGLLNFPRASPQAVVLIL